VSEPSALALRGCRPEPIGSYLKALGVLRLVADQADPEARGWWEKGGFILRSRLSRAELVGFFVERYRPSPVLDPWNADFWAGSPEADPLVPNKAVRAVAERAATEGRFRSYASSLAVAKEVPAALTRDALAKGGQNAKKRALLLALRAQVPDEAVEWLDAVAVAIDEGVNYSRLLGTGGNDGRFEISVRFAEALVLALPTVFTPQRARNPGEAVEAALFGDVSAPLETLKVGFFDPGHAGGSHSGPFDDTDGMANPWDFVLAVEGSICFAAAAARRMAWQRSLAAEPFAVVGTPGTHQTSAELEDTSEIWAPLWSSAASAGEIRRLLGEGRAVVGRRPARSGLDLAEAAASLGVDRGVEAFVRHAVVPRFGRQRLIVPIGRVIVVERPAVALLEAVDGWAAPMRRVRRKDLPWSVHHALGRLEQAEMAFATSGRPVDLQGVLGALADLELVVAQASASPSATPGPLSHVRPVPGLPARRWLTALDDGSPEFRLAVTLASARWPATQVRSPAGAPGTDLGALALLVRPLREVRGHRVFNDEGRARLVLRGRSLNAVLGDVLVLVAQRQLGSDAPRPPAQRSEALSGVVLVSPLGVSARLADLLVFLTGSLDERRLGWLLQGLTLIAWGEEHPAVLPASVDELCAVPPAFALLAPFAQGVRPDARRPRLRASPSWAARLRAGVVAPVLHEALLRLRWASLEPLVAHPGLAASSVDPGRLAAALLLRLGPKDAQGLLWRVALAREAGWEAWTSTRKEGA
jgi:CRISPR-associated protein Csx17